MNKVEFQSRVKATVRPVIFLGNAVCVDPSYFLCIFSGKESKEKKIRRVKGKRILDMTSSLRPRYFLFLRVI